MRDQYVEIKKQITFGKNILNAVIHSTLSNKRSTNTTVVDDIDVEFVHLNGTRLYLYETHDVRNNPNRYVDAIERGLQEWVKRQYDDEAVIKLKEWNGIIE